MAIGARVRNDNDDVDDLYERLCFRIKNSISSQFPYFVYYNFFYGIPIWLRSFSLCGPRIWSTTKMASVKALNQLHQV